MQCLSVLIFFFFKQKTAYEMRISDWSSDVCSSDLYVPYLKTGSSLIVLNSSKASPAVPADLCGMKVSTIKAASWTPKLTAVSDTTCKEAGKQAIRIMEFPTSPEALLALKSGAADAMMEDAAVSHQMATEMKDDIKVTSNGLIYPIVIGLGVNKNKPELRDALSKALADARDSGEYQADRKSVV